MKLIRTHEQLTLSGEAGIFLHSRKEDMNISNFPTRLKLADILHPQGHKRVGHDFVTKQQGQCFGQQYCLD